MLVALLHHLSDSRLPAGDVLTGVVAPQRIKRRRVVQNSPMRGSVDLEGERTMSKGNGIGRGD